MGNPHSAVVDSLWKPELCLSMAQVLFPLSLICSLHCLILVIVLPPFKYAQPLICYRALACGVLHRSVLMLRQITYNN
jgi:hypothetical protein